MKLIVGLGNPGDKYLNTRHNVGFMVLDALSENLEIKNFELSKKFQSIISVNSELIIAKPQTFMNESGRSVSMLARYYKLSTDSIYVVHDDLDIKLGEYKIQKGTGPKVHYGIQSIEAELGKKDFWRVRVGVDNRTPEKRTPGEDYVLQDFSNQERKMLDEVITELMVDLAKTI